MQQGKCVIDLYIQEDTSLGLAGHVTHNVDWR